MTTTPRAPVQTTIPTATETMARRSVELRGGSSCFVVVADTHSRPHPAAHGLIAAEKPDAIIHAGDIGDAAVIVDLEKIAPVIVVRGNIDSHEHDAPDALTIDLLAASQVALRILLVHIGVVGPRLRKEVALLARKERARLVICGHSHVPFIGSDKGLGVFNPGSIGPRRFQLPIVFGVMKIVEGKIQLRHVDCETGKTWYP